MEDTKHSSNRNVVAFFILTFIYSWTLWMPFVLDGVGVIKLSETLSALMTLAVMLGAFSPLLAALTLIVRKSGWVGVKNFFRKALSFKIKPIYIVLALLLPLIITAGVHFLVNFTGIDILPTSLFPEDFPVPVFVLIIPYFILVLVAGGGQEEFGWRGYAQEPLQERFGVLFGSMLLGVAWGIWHLPLWFMTGEGHSYYPFLAFLLYTISTSVILGWLYNASGKKMITAWVLHAIGNVAVPLFPILHMENVPQPGYWIWVAFNILAAIILTIWFWKRKNSFISREVS